MRTTTVLGVAMLAWVAGCSDPATTDGANEDDAAIEDDGASSDAAAADAEAHDATTDSATGDSATGDSARGDSATGDSTGDATTSADGGTIGPTGNPGGSCKGGVPAGGAPADVSKPTTVVGTGTPASCTFAALKAATTLGGVITFDCGPGAVTIPVSATLSLPTNKDTVIDGGGKITLDGGGAVQILRFDSPDFRANEHRLTLQRIALVRGKATPTKKIPPAPPPCSQGWNDGQGGALYMRDGNLTVIDAIFEGNHAAPLGPDTGGGAIYVLGSKHGALIVKSTFRKNEASNAGALGGLFCPFAIYDSLFEDNHAIGNGANSDDATKCSVINNGQHEVGSGGNGGAIYNDGASVDVLLCGDAVLNDAAGDGAFGGGLFFTSNDFGGTLTIADTTMTGNTGGHWTVVKTGTVKDAGTAVGTNAKSITITNSKLQGLP